MFLSSSGFQNRQSCVESFSLQKCPELGAIPQSSLCEPCEQSLFVHRYPVIQSWSAKSTMPEVYIHVLYFGRHYELQSTWTNLRKQLLVCLTSLVTCIYIQILSECVTSYSIHLCCEYFLLLGSIHLLLLLLAVLHFTIFRLVTVYF